MNFKQIVLLCFVVSFIAGCDSEDTPVPVVPPAVPIAPTAAEKIADLEIKGKLPKLDRSADLKGPDIDMNGIRDDVDAFISSQNYSQPQKSGVQQLAKAHQKTLTINLADNALVLSQRLEVSKAIRCIFEVFPRAPDPAVAGSVARRIESITFNTRTRLLASLAMSKALDGKVLSKPKEPFCD